jgi:hypothetical protein
MHQKYPYAVKKNTCRNPDIVGAEIHDDVLFLTSFAHTVQVPDVLFYAGVVARDCRAAPPGRLSLRDGTGPMGLLNCYNLKVHLHEIFLFRFSALVKHT